MGLEMSAKVLTDAARALIRLVVVLTTIIVLLILLVIYLLVRG